MTVHASASSENGSGGELCTACGLCCMSAIHERAKLEPEEVAWAASIGLPVDPTGGASFSLPCPKLVERKCSIFPRRPMVCPRYRCQLLRDVDAERIDLPDALKLIEEAQRLFAAATNALVADTLGEARYRARFQPLSEVLSTTGAAPADLMNERLQITALDVFLDRHFRNDRDGQMYAPLDDDGSVDVTMKEAGDRESQA